MKARKRSPGTERSLPEPKQRPHVEAAGTWLPTLTQRELQVLQLVMQGKKARAIADELGLSERTVEVHRSHIKLKLRTRSPAELRKVALSNGLYDSEALKRL